MRNIILSAAILSLSGIALADTAPVVHTTFTVGAVNITKGQNVAECNEIAQGMQNTVVTYTKNGDEKAVITYSNPNMTFVSKKRIGKLFEHGKFIKASQVGVFMYTLNDKSQVTLDYKHMLTVVDNKLLINSISTTKDNACAFSYSVKVADADNADLVKKLLTPPAAK